MPVPGENPKLDAETAVPIIYGISIGFVCVSSIIVALRLYTRYLIVRSPGADDATIAVAQVLSIGVSIATILRTSRQVIVEETLTLMCSPEANYGLGRHTWMVAPGETIPQLKVSSLPSAPSLYDYL